MWEVREGTGKGVGERKKTLRVGKGVGKRGRVVRRRKSDKKGACCFQIVYPRMAALFAFTTFSPVQYCVG